MNRSVSQNFQPHDENMSGSYRIKENSHGDYVVVGNGMSVAFDTREQAEEMLDDLKD